MTLNFLTGLINREICRYLSLYQCIRVLQVPACNRHGRHSVSNNPHGHENSTKPFFFTENYLKCCVIRIYKDSNYTEDELIFQPCCWRNNPRVSLCSSPRHLL